MDAAAIRHGAEVFVRRFSVKAKSAGLLNQNQGSLECTHFDCLGVFHMKAWSASRRFLGWNLQYTSLQVVRHEFWLWNRRGPPLYWYVNDQHRYRRITMAGCCSVQYVQQLRRVQRRIRNCSATYRRRPVMFDLEDDRHRWNHISIGGRDYCFSLYTTSKNSTYLFLLLIFTEASLKHHRWSLRGRITRRSSA